MDRKKADEAANYLSMAKSLLDEAGLNTLATHAGDLLGRVEEVLDGGQSLPGDTE
jgi:hypothetical protein